MPGPSANIPSNSRSSSFSSPSPTASANRVGSLPDTSAAREATLLSSLGAIDAHLPAGPAWSAVSETGLILPPANTTGINGTPMPETPDTLTEDDRWAIVHYVLSLSEVHDGRGLDSMRMRAGEEDHGDGHDEPGDESHSEGHDSDDGH